MNQIQEDWASIRRAAVEFGLGFVFCLFVTGLLFYEVVVVGGNCGEDSTVEIAQFLLLVFSSVLFFKNAGSRSAFDGGSFLIGAFLLCMAIRELDFITDRIPYLSWSYFVAAVVAVAGGVAWRRWRSVIHGLAVFADSRACPFMTIGLLCVLIFSRLFGSKYIWYNLYDPDDVRIVKNVVEEGLELFGYALIATASARFRLASRTSREIMKKTDHEKTVD